MRKQIIITTYLFIYLIIHWENILSMMNERINGQIAWLFILLSKLSYRK